MSLDNLPMVNKSETADTVIKFWAKKGRTRGETNLLTFKAYLARKNVHVNNNEFIQLFKDLEAASIGKIAEYKGSTPCRFTWNYSLTDVADKILNPNKLIELQLIDFSKKRTEAKKPATIPPGSMHARMQQFKQQHAPSYTQRHMPPQAETKQVIAIPFSLDSGEVIILTQTEIERLVSQWEKIKDRLSIRSF